jgi:D-glycero-alpha-D-manno-heptose-7-phosphate kinase
MPVKQLLFSEDAHGHKARDRGLRRRTRQYVEEPDHLGHFVFIRCHFDRKSCRLSALLNRRADMIVEASAPTRVDLAGGTIDIWPLYLFHRNAVTVNFAINLHAKCRVSSRADSKIVLHSRDTGQTAEFDGLEQIGATSQLKLLARLISFFSPGVGLDMVTDCAAPSGSGLAGSSALNIAICGALNRFTNAGYSPISLIGIAKNVEAQVIDVPTGDQDYYPATFGGLQAIHLSVGGVVREEIAADLNRLSERLVIVYSGRQRNSGINNWEVMKRHIDGDPKIASAFEGIIAASTRMRSTLLSGRLDGIDEALEEEWANRRLLSDGITTPEIEEIIAKARSFGSGAAKICGAGGGGCVVLTVPEGRRRDLEQRLVDAGVQVLNYNIVQRGLEIQTIQN